MAARKPKSVPRRARATQQTTQKTATTPAPKRALSARDGPARILLGTRKGLIVLARSGSSWRVLRHAHLGIPVVYAFADPRTRTWWASLDHGHWGCKLSRSQDSGQTWTEVAPPNYPEGAEVKAGEPATLKYIWTIAPGGVNEPGRLYLGTQPGGLFTSDDDGASWRLVDALWNHPSRLAGNWFGGGRDQAAIHSILVDPRDVRRVLVGVSCAGVFETLDGGDTWQARNAGLRADFMPDPEGDVGHDPHCMTWSAANPDVLWQQNHCGIFRSTDGARTWKLRSKKGAVVHFGFAIAADEHDPAQAWVVPQVADECRVAPGGKLVTAHTRDGGKTWKTATRGLPQRDAYDVVYRHALDQRAGTLCFGSTTGNVYVSGDRGTSWTCVANHLPPVYSVRFA